MASPFGALLADALARNRVSQRDFGRKIGRSGVFVSLVIRGRRRVPLKDIDRWTAAVNVPKRTRDAMRLQGLLSHCPMEIQVLVEQLRRRRKAGASPR